MYCFLKFSLLSSMWLFNLSNKIMTLTGFHNTLSSCIPWSGWVWFMFKPEGPATPGLTGPPALLVLPWSGHSKIKTNVNDLSMWTRDLWKRWKFVPCTHHPPLTTHSHSDQKFLDLPLQIDLKKILLTVESWISPHFSFISNQLTQTTQITWIPHQLGLNFVFLDQNLPW